MKILILGSGAREHAIGWKLLQSPKAEALFFAPGNAGTSALGKNLDLSMKDDDQLTQFMLDQGIGMLVIGPEAPLVDGLVDRLSAKKELSHLKIIGPTQAGAQLEGSKAFAKAFMEEQHIPTAAYAQFGSDEEDQALEYISGMETPIVLKADGLAAGKGVLICHSHEEAKEECKAMLDGKFGAASAKLVIEEFMDGIEFSVFVLTDGTHYQILPVAKDYKRIGEGDTGLNTGGMGSVSPVPFVDEAMMQKVKEEVIEPTLDGLQKRGITYKGFIFIGLMNENGQPKVVEYNCRMGDPETQVVMSRLDTDLMDLLSACADGTLDSFTVRETQDHAVCIVLASGGYPLSYEKGKSISLHEADERPAIHIFHAGTRSEEGQLLTHGGRVLSVVGKGTTFAEAKNAAYEAAEKISFDRKYFRSDIGFDLDEN
jgi:phosphoribosylamine--glycine ligase